MNDPPAATGGGACSDPPLRISDDFDDGVLAPFTAHDPSAFDFDHDHPIFGAASLRVKPTSSSYLSLDVANHCSAEMRFKFRATAEFIASGGNLIRVNAGSRPPPSITSIELGSTPGILSDPHGTYWIDDLLLD